MNCKSRNSLEKDRDFFALNILAMPCANLDEPKQIWCLFSGLSLFNDINLVSAPKPLYNVVFSLWILDRYVQSLESKKKVIPLPGSLYES